MDYVTRFGELPARHAVLAGVEVYKLSPKLSKGIFEISSRSGPKEEMYSLTDQVRRSARSVGAQIGEAWTNRLPK